MGWSSNAPVPWKWLHMQTHILRPARYHSLHIARCLMRVWVLDTQWIQWMRVPHRLYTLLRDWLMQLCLSILHSLGKQPTQLALYFIGMFMETSYTGVQVLLWATRKSENQVKLIQGILVIKKCFLRGQSCQAEGLSENRKNLFWITWSARKDEILEGFWKWEGNVDIPNTATDILCDLGTVV